MAALKRILYVDNDREACLLMRDLVAPHEVDIAPTDEEARVLARRRSYDLYIVTGGGPTSSGVALCAWLQRIDGRTPIVFCSSNGTARYQQSAIEAGAVRYLVKPLDPPVLRSTLTLLLKLAELETSRAVAAAQKAVSDAGETVVDGKCAVRARAYRAFREAGGNRANFERLWPGAFDRATA